MRGDCDGHTANMNLLDAFQILCPGAELAGVCAGQGRITINNSLVSAIGRTAAGISIFGNRPVIISRTNSKISRNLRAERTGVVHGYFRGGRAIIPWSSHIRTTLESQ